ncbi:phosphoglycolate phosphatase [Enterobacteriaceae bacterium H11S18]|uniref:phosphoglycolate phosphatase n=1 Tax=Dryocola clanedunensis TaxID=2925396 RepID=UPI0022F04E77|nr:phosphoglycolate phosphatase [Dryocola clanedunensis]MCT4705040.1 phosphoglycolate phosphatase [Dryocola clanedunensis]MCT4710164.1 phosphoglycolate phosphatase [Dryocola clanedunensis]
MDKLDKLRGVAFDLDGTLVDTALGLTQAMDQALYALELPTAGEDNVEKWIGNGADVLVQRALTWALKGQEPTFDQCLMARKLFDSYYAQTVEEGSFLFPGVADTLAALAEKGVPMGLVTNKPTPFVLPLLESLGIAKHFTVIIGGDDVQNKKPHPEPLLKVMETLNISAAEMLFVGDSRNDILAAQAAGCPSVGMTYGYNYGESIALSKPDYVLDKFSDLLPAFGLSCKDNQEADHE